MACSFKLCALMLGPGHGAIYSAAGISWWRASCRICLHVDLWRKHMTNLNLPQLGAERVFGGSFLEMILREC